MKKGKSLKRIAAAMLAVTLILSNSMFLYADEETVIDGGHTEEVSPSEAPLEEDPSEAAVTEPSTEGEEGGVEQKQEEEKKEEPQKEEKKEEEKEEEEPEKVSKISVDKSILSFGTIKASESPRPLSFIITNDGSSDVSLGWSQTDSSGIFLLNMPSEVNAPLEPGKSIQGSVEIDRAKISTGDFATTLIFRDTAGSDAEDKIDVSIRVEKDSPSISAVKIRPNSASLRQGDSMSFDVSVEGENDPDR
nr:hypothetical protein [Lachnospiraceae bacterium]